MINIKSKKPFIPKKYMHPRNIYRQKTDFTKLAIDYPEFRNIVKQVWFIISITILRLNFCHCKS